ncbi:MULTISPECIES: hypothetical protein [Kitasatospora]|uniref:Uncharacterized protein n=2 Tax=Kitasatospora TaxID=2063 RepID=A0ABT1J125_9ACTN|nr:hypothetical protein [Kitasatospora paracochleata]MCP2310843.1 hypothetical protein [Kitasatospora paracochleata]
MASEYEISDDELMEVADNPAQAAELHKALRTLASNPKVGGELQALAREALSGRIGIAEMIQSPRYLDAVGVKLEEMRRAADDMSPEERKASDERARKMRDEQQRD